MSFLLYISQAYLQQAEVKFSHTEIVGQVHEPWKSLYIRGLWGRRCDGKPLLMSIVRLLFSLSPNHEAHSIST